VEALGGKFHITSAEGTGTSLHVTLPLGPEAHDGDGIH
jgi:signal transduction histidine kinase